MSEIVNIYRKNTTNIGDEFSNPEKYFDFLKNIETIEFTEMSPEYLAKYVENKNVILGGGGLLEQEYFKDHMKFLLDSDFKNLIGWGIGHNMHGRLDALFSSYDYLDKFDLLGVRDSVPIFDWVPCSSCMHFFFDKDYGIKNDIVIYEHENFPLKEWNTDFPKKKNSDSFEEVVEFLGSALLVITNSYHGAYWATLLGRRVLIVQPFSSKFFNFKHPLVVANNFDIKDIENLPVYPKALEECRERNVKFAELVRDLIIH
ncbi:MAG: hypothetical protein ACQESA_00260 [Patescibacteria group bacterium]